MTILQQPTDGAQTKSPILYLAEELEAGVTFFQCRVFIWRGAKASIPAEPLYTLKKVPVYANGTRATFDVSSLVDSELKASLVSTLVNAGWVTSNLENVWVHCKITTFGNNTPVEVGTNTIIANRGYTEYLEGVNATSPLFLNNGTQHRLTDSNTFIAAISNKLGNTFVTLRLLYDTALFTDFVNPLTDTTQSANNIIYFDVSPNIAEPDVNYTQWYKVQLLNGANEVLDELTIYRDLECKYQSLSLSYQNKWGAWDWQPFNFKNVQTTEVERDEYLFNQLKVVGSTMTYDEEEGNIRTFNVKSRRSITLNTGFLAPEAFTSIKEILQSTDCYIIEQNKAVIPKQNSITRQNYVNRDMIQYSIEFIDAFENINIVR